MFPSAVPGYILPNMTQGQTNFYAPTRVPQTKTIPIGIFTTFSLREDSQRFGIRKDDTSNFFPADDIISAFNDILYKLTLCDHVAGNLEETSDIIVQMLNNCSDEKVLAYIVESLFEKCLNDPSFQNTGATLVQNLICKLKTTQTFANFGNLFLLRCKEEYLKSSETVLRLCRLSIFIGVLFFNQGVAGGRIVQCIPVLRFLIKSLLLVLLEHSTDVTVSCAVQVLKGADICKPDKGLFSEVFLYLQELQSCNHLSPKTKKSITFLLDLLVPSGSSEQTRVSSVNNYELPLTATMLADSPQQEHKQLLGERLFPLIQSMYPDLAGKITGMLLEIDNSELLHMLESKESLESKVQEAVGVLQANQAKETALTSIEATSYEGWRGNQIRQLTTPYSALEKQAMNSARPGSLMTTLYVGDLHPDVTEAMLFEKVSFAGPVLNIRVCRDKNTGSSLGYAYVNFQQQGDAERALDVVNFDNFKGRPIRIMWSRTDPYLRKPGVGSVFINYLDKSIDNEALYDTFSAFGNILSCKIVCDKNGSRGYGFIHFETEEAARNCIEKVNGMLLKGKKVFVERFMNRRERLEILGDKMKKFNNVYVKNFSDDMSEDDLKDIFEPFGKLINVKIMSDIGGKSRGFGFVSYEEPEAAEKAVEDLNGLTIQDKTLFAGRAQKRAERQTELRAKFERIRMERINRHQGVNLYVKNLDENIDDERLRKEFSKFGTITSAKVERTEGGRSNGFGFVCFSSPEEATKAVREMHGRIVGERSIYVTLAQQNGDRKARLASKYMQRIARIKMQGEPAAGMMSQMFPLAGPGYILPTMIQGQRNFYAPTQVPQIRASPRWPTQLRQPTPASGFQNLPGQLVRPGNPAAIGARQPGQGNIRGGMNAIPITGQSGTGQPPRMPQSVPCRGQVPPLAAVRNPASRYSATLMRNPPQAGRHQNMVIPQPSAQGGVIQVQGQEPLTATMLADAPQQEQKQMLGERLFLLIQSMYPDLAGKITGMLLEIDNSKLLHMLESKESLEAKVNEAVAVLQAHQAKETAPSTETAS